MVERFLISVILFLAIFALVPSLFSEGGAFDITAKVIDECTGKETIIHGIYFDNVYNLMLYLGLSGLGVSVPFIFRDKISRNFRGLSFLISAWFIAGTSFEVANFLEPLVVYNTADNRSTWGYFLYCFILGLTLIMISEKWTKLKALER